MQKHAWQITKLVPHFQDSTKQMQQSEYIVAETLNQVLDYLKIDMQDESTEIETIARLFPIVEILNSKN